MKMKFLPALALAMFASAASHAAAPASAPAGSTGMCKDGSYYDGAEKKGACKGHKGVKDWWGADKPQGKTDATPAAAAPATGSKPAVAAASATGSKPTVAAATPAPTASAPRKMPTKAENITAAPGGGPGLVWVNESSKVYHCQGDEWYGKTKKGEYVKEADAKAKGAKPAGGKACAA